MTPVQGSTAGGYGGGYGAAVKHLGPKMGLSIMDSGFKKRSSEPRSVALNQKALQFLKQISSVVGMNVWLLL